MTSCECLRRRLSVSRVRENRMHGLMRRLRVADFATLALLYCPATEGHCPATAGFLYKKYDVSFWFLISTRCLSNKRLVLVKLRLKMYV